MAGFVFIKQLDAMQCGAAYLAMLFHLYGGNLVLPLNPEIGRIKPYTLAGYDCPKSDGPQRRID